MRKEIERVETSLKRKYEHLLRPKQLIKYPYAIYLTNPVIHQLIDFQSLDKHAFKFIQTEPTFN